jgi:HAD superfamily hydrolase (TIGR01484 family)
MKNIHNKKLIVFDLDGTLAPSKSAMDGEMSRLFDDLLARKKVAVIGGGRYSLFKMQLLEPLKELKTQKELLVNLSLFPTTATAFYRYDHGWKNVYTKNLSKKERAKIRKAFFDVFKETHYEHPKKTYGPLIEDRGTQVSFSVFGQNIVAALGKKGIQIKDKWRRENTPLKLKLAKLVQGRLPELEVHAAGYTTIDVTHKGIDKAYGLHQIEKYLHISIKDMIFIGDALFPGGNDYAVKKTGVQAIPVSGPEETKKIIRKIIKE